MDKLQMLFGLINTLGRITLLIFKAIQGFPFTPGSR